jgi:hypothetical protein
MMACEKYRPAAFNAGAEFALPAEAATPSGSPADVQLRPDLGSRDLGVLGQCLPGMTVKGDATVTQPDESGQRPFLHPQHVAQPGLLDLGQQRRVEAARQFGVEGGRDQLGGGEPGGPVGALLLLLDFKVEFAVGTLL